MLQTCTICRSTFEITQEDLAFYDKISPVVNDKKFPIPAPTRCHDCRNALRMSFRNERHLYRRICDSCRKPLLSIYQEHVPFPVYCYNCFWSDSWDARLFGTAYDPGHRFFEQFAELFKKVPRLGIVTGHNENCDYCNYVNYSKNSYLCFGCHNVDRCYHNWRVHWSESCVDCLQMDRSHFCYECVDCESCYHLSFSQDCDGCSDSTFLYDCRSCKNCIGCTGLRSKQYCIFNQGLGKEEYEQQRSALQLDTNEGITHMRERCSQFLLGKPHRALFIQNSEDVEGDHIFNSRRLYECYHVKDAEDCRYLESCEQIKDSMDNTFSGWPAELVYETMSAGVRCYRELFCAACWSCSDLLYCDSCHHSKDLLGCIGLRQKNQYCILNVQYEEKNYNALREQILTAMTERGEFGNFFPPSLSPHAYNETIAAEFFPLSKEEAEQRGFHWKEMVDDVPKVDRLMQSHELPQSIDAVSNEVLNWAVTCENTGRPFRIIKQELSFYREHSLPLPRLHPDERHRRRMAMRNPRKLWKRACAKCKKEIQTTYSPERLEIVYCEECYLKEVY